ncbi:MAG: beta-glucosidase [Chloroflexi bacterium]|nr:beta-glucosidase [Chloroflexota bacterium]
MTISDKARSIDARVSDLLGQMTVDEKLAQLGAVWIMSVIDEQRAFAEDRAKTEIGHGIGQITRVAAATLLPPTESATLANQVQRFLVENTRLGIPAIIHEESCAGYMARGATTFPQAIGMAATWEPDLVERLADVIRVQMRAVGAHHTLAPVLDITRDPRWGRVEETLGEDPYLTATIGTAYVRGVQGDLENGIAATGKHFVGYGMSEGGLNWAPAHIPARELREVYLAPFWAAIQAGGLATIMNGYQELDGVPCGASKELLTDILRGEMGFEGTVVADYFTLNMLSEYHHVAADKSDAARQALEAGLDVELPATSCYGDPLRAALDAGQVDMALIDTSVRRVLRLKFQLGLFEQPYVDAGQAITVFNTPEQRDLSLEAARKSIVLLKNADNLLPLAPDLDSLAVIGPSADSIRLLQGDYHYPSHMEGVFISDVNMDSPNPLQDLSASDIMEHFIESVSVLQGIRAAVSSHTTIHYAEGCTITGDDTSGFAEAVAAAEQAQVAIVVIGGMSGLAMHCTTGESLDRAHLDLPGVQQQLVEAIHATGTPVVIVLLNGRPLSIPWIAEHVPAVVEAWLPAQEGGTAVASVLFGAYNPGGRLPISFPRSVGQVPVFYGHKPAGGRTHWQGDYIDLSTKPLFPFGHGLSFTTFKYSDLAITPEEAAATGSVSIQAVIENTGTRAGEEVVQLYVHDRVASVTRPVQELKGFVRILLEPGEKKTVTFTLPVAMLGFYNREMAFVVEPGEIEVMVGSSSADIRARRRFTITGDVTPVPHTFFSEVTVE